MPLTGMTMSQAQGSQGTQSQSGHKRQKTGGQPPDERLAKAHKLFEEANAMSGTVKRLELFNFMNHGHLQVDLKPGVNFVFGRNGSGKSALLTGCMAGLGCKASAVGRGSKLEGFIKNDKHEAKVRVHLFNGGADAYQPEIFGNEIVIERRIVRKQGGKHVAFSADGVQIYTKSSEIQDICDHFNIQVSNPCVVLTQENAKKFLSGTDDRSRYDFFMRATGLEVTKQNLLSMRADLEKMEANLQTYEDCLPELMAEVDNTKKAYEEARALENIDADMAACEVRIEWAGVLKARACADVAARDVDEQAHFVHEAQAKVQRALELATEAERSYEDHKAGSSSMTDEVQHRSQVIRNLKDRSQKLERERSAAKAKADGEEKKALVLRQKGKMLRDEAEKQRRSFAEKQQEADRRRAAERERLHAARDKANLDLQEARARDQALRDAPSPEEAAAQARRQEEQLAHEVRQLKAELLQVRSCSGMSQRAAAFGRDMPRVLAALETNSRRFRKMPVGPVGACISIVGNNQGWAPAVEAALGPSLMATFVVDSHEDRVAFEAMCRQQKFDNGWRPPTLVLPFGDGREYNIPDASLPDPRACTRMWDVVSFTHPIVQQACVDKAGIERMVLVKDREEGTRLMFGAQPPRNTYKAFTVNGYSMFQRNGVHANERPPNGFDPRRKKLGVDFRERLAGLEEDLRTKEVALGQARDDSRAVLQAAQGRTAEERRLAELIRRARASINKLSGDIDQLNSDAGVEESTAEAQLEEAREMEDKADALLNSAEDLRERMREVEQQLAPTRSELQQRQTEAQQLVDQEAGHAERLNQLYQAKNRQRKALDKCNQQLAQLDAARGNALAAKQQAEHEAREREERVLHKLQGAPPPSDVRADSEDGLKNRLKRLRKQKQDALSRTHGRPGPDAEALHRAYEAAEKRLQEGQQRRDNVQVDHEALSKALSLRSKQWRADRKNMAKEASNAFDYEMKNRSLAGKLIFEHAKEDHASSLAIEVQTHCAERNAAKTQNVATLSGGERSFTTMAFQIAMWGFIEVPFRCMDEFDVFMDDHFRRQAITSLLDVCDQTPACQFLFLTPQDMSSMLDNDGNERNIFRMPDPRETE